MPHVIYPPNKTSVHLKVNESRVAEVEETTSNEHVAGTRKSEVSMPEQSLSCDLVEDKGEVGDRDDLDDDEILEVVGVPEEYVAPVNGPAEDRGTEPVPPPSEPARAIDVWEHVFNTSVRDDPHGKLNILVNSKPATHDIMSSWYTVMKRADASTFECLEKIFKGGSRVCGRHLSDDRIRAEFVVKGVFYDDRYTIDNYVKWARYGSSYNIAKLAKTFNFYTFKTINSVIDLYFDLHQYVDSVESALNAANPDADKGSRAALWYPGITLALYKKDTCRAVFIREVLDKTISKTDFEYLGNGFFTKRRIRPHYHPNYFCVVVKRVLHELDVRYRDTYDLGILDRLSVSRLMRTGKSVVGGYIGKVVKEVIDDQGSDAAKAVVGSTATGRLMEKISSKLEEGSIIEGYTNGDVAVCVTKFVIIGTSIGLFCALLSKLHSHTTRMLNKRLDRAYRDYLKLSSTEYESHAQALMIKDDHRRDILEYVREEVTEWGNVATMGANMGTIAVALIAAGSAAGAIRSLILTFQTISNASKKLDIEPLDPDVHCQCGRTLLSCTVCPHPYPICRKGGKVCMKCSGSDDCHSKCASCRRWACVCSTSWTSALATATTYGVPVLICIGAITAVVIHKVALYRKRIKTLRSAAADGDKIKLVKESTVYDYELVAKPVIPGSVSEIDNLEIEKFLETVSKEVNFGALLKEAIKKPVLTATERADRFIDLLATTINRGGYNKRDLNKCIDFILYGSKQCHNATVRNAVKERLENARLVHEAKRADYSYADFVGDFLDFKAPETIDWDYDEGGSATAYAEAYACAYDDLYDNPIINNEFERLMDSGTSFGTFFGTMKKRKSKKCRFESLSTIKQYLAGRKWFDLCPGNSTKAVSKLETALSKSTPDVSELRTLIKDYVCDCGSNHLVPEDCPLFVKAETLVNASQKGKVKSKRAKKKYGKKKNKSGEKNDGKSSNLTYESVNGSKKVSFKTWSDVAHMHYERVVSHESVQPNSTPAHAQFRSTVLIGFEQDGEFKTIGKGFRSGGAYYTIGHVFNGAMEASRNGLTVKFVVAISTGDSIKTQSYDVDWTTFDSPSSTAWFAVGNFDTVARDFVVRFNSPKLPEIAGLPMIKEKITGEHATMMSRYANVTGVLRNLTPTYCTGTTECIPMHMCSTTDGDSGSPVFASVNGNYVVVGVHCGGGSKGNIMVTVQKNEISGPKASNYSYQNAAEVEGFTVEGYPDHFANAQYVEQNPFPDGYHYQYLVPTMKINPRSIPNVPSHHKRHDSYMLQLLQKSYPEASRKYGVSVESLDALHTALKKCDKPHALNLTMAEKQHMVNQAIRLFRPIAGFSESSGDIEYNPKSSPGKFWKNAGYKTKHDLFESEAGPICVQAGMNQLDNYYSTASYASLKIEPRPMEKLNDDKVRLFISCLADVNVSQNFMFGDMLNRFKEAGSRYLTPCCIGMKVHHGGFIEFANAFINYYPIVGDFSDYDGSMVFELMSMENYVYYVLGNYKSNSAIKRLLALVHNSAFSALVLPNGLVLLRRSLRPSGDYTTSVGGSVVNVMAFSHCYSLYYKRDMVNDIIDGKFLLYVYSDDNAHAFSRDSNLKPWLEEDYARCMATVGINHKAGTYRSSYPDKTGFDGFNFLGLEYVKTDDGIVPIFDRERAAAILYSSTESKPSNEKRFTRCMAALILTAFDTEMFNAIAVVAHTLRKRVSFNGHHVYRLDDERVIRVKCGAVPTQRQAQALWTGHENRYDVIDIDYVHHQSAMEVGRHIKKIMRTPTRSHNQLTKEIEQLRKQNKLLKSSARNATTKLAKMSMPQPASVVESIDRGVEDLSEADCNSLGRNVVVRVEKIIPAAASAYLIDPDVAYTSGVEQFGALAVPGARTRPLHQKVEGVFDGLHTINGVTSGSHAFLYGAHNRGYMSTIDDTNGEPAIVGALPFIYRNTFTDDGDRMSKSDAYSPLGRVRFFSSAPADPVSTIPMLMVDTQAEKTFLFSTVEDDISVIRAPDFYADADDTVLRASFSVCDPFPSGTSPAAATFGVTIFVRTVPDGPWIGFNTENTVGELTVSHEHVGFVHQFCVVPYVKSNRLVGNDICVEARFRNTVDSDNLRAHPDCNVFVLNSFPGYQKYDQQIDEAYPISAALRLTQVGAEVARGGSYHAATLRIEQFGGGPASVGGTIPSISELPNYVMADMLEGVNGTVRPSAIEDYSTALATARFSKGERVQIIRIECPDATIGGAGTTIRSRFVTQVAFTSLDPILDDDRHYLLSPSALSKIISQLPDNSVSSNAGHVSYFRAIADRIMHLPSALMKKGSQVAGGAYSGLQKVERIGKTYGPALAALASL